MATSPMNFPDRSTDLEMTHQHKGISIPGAPAHPLEDKNILADILLGLPPLPSSLPRASPVSKLWHGVVSDPRFHRRFRAHHKKAPLLGFFYDNDRRIDFMSALDPPNCIPASCFSSMPRQEGAIILECRHGLVLFCSFMQQQFVVWDPITGDHHDVPVPPSFNESGAFVANGAVVCAARENGHVLGACHSDPFQVVFLGWNRNIIFACTYSSEAGTWGNLISLQQPPHQLHVMTVSPDFHSFLVHDSLYWVPLIGGQRGILKFDLHRQTLALIDLPSDDSFNFSTIQVHTQLFIVPSDAGALSLIVLVGFSVHVWKMITNGEGATRWILKNTVELSDLLSLKPRGDSINMPWSLRILGVDEDNKVMFKLSDSGVIYMVHLETLQFKVLPMKMVGFSVAHPFMSFYTPGRHIDEAGNVGEENVNKA